MKLEYQVTFGRQLTLLSHCLLSNILIFGIGYYLLRDSTTSTSALATTFFVGLAFQLLTSIIPTFSVHIQYLIKNRNAKFIIDKFNRELSYSTKGNDNQKFDYSFEDIVSLDYCCSFGLSNSGWYSFAKYDYCKIKFKDNNVIVVTCLMMDDVRKTLEDILRMEVEIKRKFIAFV